MGLPGIVKIALSLIESFSKSWLSILEQVNKSPELVDRLASFRDQLLMGQAEALKVYIAFVG